MNWAHAPADQWLHQVVSSQTKTDHQLVQIAPERKKRGDNMVMRTQVAAASSGEVVKGRGAITKSTELGISKPELGISKPASSELGSGEKRGGRGRWRKSLVQAIKV